MNHSKTSEPVRNIKVKNSLEATFNFRHLREAFDNYIFSHQLSGCLSQINDLSSLISSFARVVKQNNQQGTVNLPQSVLEEQLNFYRQRQEQYRSREDKLNSEVVILMRSLSQKEQQIIEKENQIFGYKLKLEHKEKQLLQIKKFSEDKKNQIRRPPIIKVNNVSDSQKTKYLDKQSSSIYVDSKAGKLLTNQGILPLNTYKNNQKNPLRSEPPSPYSLKVVSSLSLGKQISSNKIQWPQQRERLLRLLRQKDQRIYQLIQQISGCK